ncbi:MAG: ABC transporter ATP-binding protein [Burkholderiales bacterium]
MSAPILCVRDLSVCFGALVAVNDISFDVLHGSITSVIGPNGAGKSTLFNLISGAIKPTAGRVEFDGADITGAAPHRTLAAGLSRSFQITNLFFELTVYENLRLAAQIVEPGIRAVLPLKRSSAARDRVEHLIAQFGFETKASELVGYLSHGEQRRLEIAVALACKPRMLLLDEPTQGMSQVDTMETEKLIKSLAEDLTILLIEHDVDVVMNLSDHVVVMHQGAKLAGGTPAEVRANPAVQAAYFGDPLRA